ncbi:MAG: sigma-54-dependent Fis family transcriptional regulator [Opitutales bacterium]|nr:sigma-54-dependent Fis family transcriptional regulator [Opitutales bacterium]MCH8540209.1 response regulator [Opitutales bacterium]
MASILIVDDLSSIHELLETVLKPTGHELVFETDGEQAVNRYKSQDFDIVLSDISMQPMDGITMLHHIKEYDPNCVVVMMTGYASTETAIKALKLGAFDYIKKPFKVDELLGTLNRGLEYRKALLEDPEGGEEGVNANLSSEELEKLLPGASDTMRKVRQQIIKQVSSTSPIFLQGPKGIGKRRAAAFVHHQAVEEPKPFLTISCNPEQKDSFKEKLIGDGSGGEWVESAQGGSLLIEQLELLDKDLQKELVELLKNKGGSVRFIFSSEVDLEEKVDQGEFSDDLFYRIASFPIQIPSLKEHAEDIPGIAETLLKNTHNPSFKPAQLEFNKEALEVLKSYDWPENMKELRDYVIEIGDTTGERIIKAEQLPFYMTKS